MEFSRQEYWSGLPFPFSWVSSWPRDRTHVSCIAGGFFYCWATRESWWLNGETERGQWHPTPVLLPGKSHGQRSLVGCSPWGRVESDTTEQLHFHFSLSCIGEGNGNPLQCSCLENPRHGGAWWAAVYGVAQSWTQLKRLSSSSSSYYYVSESLVLLYLREFPVSSSLSTA